MEHDETRALLVELSASLFARGFSSGSAGNISVKVPGGYLMTPTRSSFGRLDPARLSLLDADWNLIAGDPPSREVVMHRPMYQARPEAGAIVYLHSVYVTALSCLPRGEGPLIPPLTPFSVASLGRDVPGVPYYRPADPAMNDDILAAGARGAAVVLTNHGSLVAGKTLLDAVNAAEELEVSAKLAFLVRGRDARELTEAQIDDVLRH